VIVDLKTTEVIYADNANLPVYPASLTKLMTIYLIFEAIQQGKLAFTDQKIISVRAQRQTGSKMGLRKGKTITIRELILGLIIRSANDAAIVAAEAVAGSEQAFVWAMNQRASVLGMKDTVFKNASGLPDPQQVTTARDMAVLAIALKKRFPRYFHLFSEKQFRYGKRLFKTHNYFPQKFTGAVGMKTGFTCDAGYNLVTLVNRGKQRLIGVIFGESTSKKRDQRLAELMDMALLDSQKKVKRKTLDRIRHDTSQGAGGKINKRTLALSCGRPGRVSPSSSHSLSSSL